MNFVKMHGAGNDYVYIDGFTQTVANPSQLAIQISQRQKGIGSDGLILVLPPDPALEGFGIAHCRMRMFNSDGSEGQMCGNGIRCVCKFAHDHQLFPDARSARPMHIQTPAGMKTLDYTLDPQGHVKTVTVDMGPPMLELPHIPVDERKLDEHTIDATYVSMGNPHAVFFMHDSQPIEQPSLGQQLEQHHAYPKRMNVHFARVESPTRVRVYHWERGSGPTLACGTGACAVAVAGVLTGKTQRRITAALPGGELIIEWREADQHVLMTGPAVEVYTGHWPD